MCPQRKKTDEANDEDREMWGVSQAEHDAAFAWADDEDELALPADAEPFPLWPCNLGTADLFLHCQSQWIQLPAGGGYAGMSYPGVQIVIDNRVPHRRRRSEFERLQHMEFSALQEMNRG